MKKYQHSILGGTFDHFHVGHQALLDAAFAQSEHVTIGLTTEKFYADKLLSQTIEKYETRKAKLETYLRANAYLPRATTMQLTDIYGPALSEPNIDAIFVTENTLTGAEKINTQRETIGFPKLEILTVPFVLATDGKPITSERIRLGEIDMQGNVYVDVFSLKQALVLPESLKETLREPIGKVYTDENALISDVQRALFVITVGDIVTLTLIKRDISSQISIIDLKTRRHVLAEDETQLLQLQVHTSLINPSGKINPEIASLLLKTIKSAFRDPQTILVEGEEDLLTLPAILLAPLESLVIYGQFDKGAIVVRVTPERKEFVKNLLKQFNL